MSERVKDSKRGREREEKGGEKRRELGEIGERMNRLGSF